MIAVLKNCTAKVKKLMALVDDLEPGFASNSSRVRKWSAFKAALKSDRLKKFHAILEGLKTTLILVQQNYHGYLRSLDCVIASMASTPTANIPLPVLMLTRLWLPSQCLQDVKITVSRIPPQMSFIKSLFQLVLSK